MKRLSFLAMLLVAAIGLTAQPAQAHEPGEISFLGEAVEACVEPGSDWSVVWTIANDEEANPFGIIATTPFDVTFAPLEDDDAPGEFIPPGEVASGASSHAYSAEAVQLYVEHDVTDGPNTLMASSVVERPVDCEPDALGSITVLKDANGAGSLDFDFDGSFGPFNLDNDESMTFFELEAGSYLIDEIGAAGWMLESIDCGSANTSDEDIEDGDIRVHLAAGEEVTCQFTNVPMDEPTATPTSSPSATPTAVPPTPTPQAPVPDTIVIHPTVVVTVNQVITPPNTGSGGLVERFMPRFTVSEAWGWWTGSWCYWRNWGRDFC